MSNVANEVTSFMREYEAASNHRDLDLLASLIADDATYEIRDLELVTVTQQAAVCRYRFAWKGVVNGEPRAGSGRGTNVVVKRDGTWQMLHEHLSA
jgi:ketosteroid isomerase-like protein